MADSLKCLWCTGTGKNKHGGPCQDCKGSGTVALSSNAVWRGFQVTGYTLHAFFKFVQVLAALAIVGLIAYLVVLLVTG
jgi:hypothetical protein